jgi:hypothetical protein
MEDIRKKTAFFEGVWHWGGVDHRVKAAILFCSRNAGRHPAARRKLEAGIDADKSSAHTRTYNFKRETWI